jgi:uncharacterized membrane protein
VGGLVIKKTLFNLLSIGLILLAVLLFLPSNCFSRSYDILQVEIDAEILPDGSMRVVETRTFNFSGRFRGFEQSLDFRGGIDYTDIQVREGEKLYVQVDEFPTSKPDTFALQRQEDSLLVDWSYMANNETRSFVLEYTVQDVVVVHEDVAELGHIFIGDRWEIPAKNVLVNLTLPAGADKADLLAWGHGPQHGAVKIKGPRLITWEISRLPAETYLGGRVTFPPELVPQATRLSSREALPGIINEEEAHTRRANLIRVFEPIVSVILLVLAGLAVFLLWKQSANRGEAYKGDYYRDLPGDYPPEIAGYLLSRRKIMGSFISAAILNLARRGFLRIEKLQPAAGSDADYRLIKTEREESLNSLDRRLYSFLFETILSENFADEKTSKDDDGPVSVTFSQIQDYAKKEPEKFGKFYRDWKGAVRRIGDKRGFFESYHYRPWQIAAAILIGLLVYVSLERGFIFLLVAATISLLALLFLAPKHWYTDYGADQRAKWEAFERYLCHFSNIRDSSVSSLVVWEHFLVYAVAFGYAGQVINQLTVAKPTLPSDHKSGTRLFGIAGSEITGETSLFQGFSTMNLSLTKTLGRAHSRIVFKDSLAEAKIALSSPFTGGGFSGGGGRSSGGGGGRAR